MQNLFWPILVILAGVLFLLNAVLPVNIPVWRILIAVALVWVGIGMITDRNPLAPNRLGISLSESKDSTDGRTAKFSRVFTDERIDLCKDEMTAQSVQISGVFSSLTVRLPVDRAVTIHGSGAFCQIAMPDGQNIVFGEGLCLAGSRDENAPKLYVDASCAFGSITFEIE